MTQISAAIRRRPSRASRALVLFGALVFSPLAFVSPAGAQALGYAPAEANTFPQSAAQDSWQSQGSLQNDSSQDQAASQDEDSVLPERLRRAVVNLDTREAPGTVIIDTGHTVLYYVLGGGKAIRYGVGVGRQGFTWSGVQTISRKAEWPDWYPPAEMVARQPYLPRFMAGGPGNPLGARAMYLGNSEYRIHGTNDPTTIGKFVSSGCIRLTNEDVEDLFSRVNVGTRVVVLPKNAPLQARATAPARVEPARAPAVISLPSGRQAMSIPLSRVD